jgi:hypothetical protein
MIRSPSQFSALCKAFLVALLAATALGGLVPVLGTVARAGDQYAAQQVGDPDITIAYTGEEAVLRIEVRNAGVETWTRDQVVLSNVEQPLNAEGVQSLPTDTPPGEIATWEFQVRAPDRPGAFRSGWQLKHDGQAFSPMLTAYLIVLPEGAPELEAQIREKIDEWKQQAEKEIDDLMDEIATMILEEVEGFFQRLIDNVRDNVCGASALIVLGALLLWWRRS